MAMTLDQARFHLQTKLDFWREDAQSRRQQALLHQRAAAVIEDAHMRGAEYNEAARWNGQARAIEQDVEALDLVLKAATPDGGYDG